jgi:AdoMet-dependent heme synthase
MKGTPFSFFVQWHLTERCNMKCRHCYQHGSTSELDHAQICRAIENMNVSFKEWEKEYSIELIRSMNFTGGEPFLRKDLFEILNFVRDRGFSISIMSNGTTITDLIARKLAEIGPVHVQVSLEGMEKVHDSIRGNGSFKRAIKGISRLVNNGVETSTNTTLSRLNSSQVRELVDLGEKAGLSAVTFSRLVPCGSGLKLLKDMLASVDLAAIYRDLHEIHSEKLQVLSRDPLAEVAHVQGDIPDTEFPIAGCAAGLFGITVASDGSVMPCRRMNLVIGNITRQPFREIWESPVLWSLRNRKFYHGKCGVCRYWMICRGCRAVALAVSRLHGEEDYLGSDPQCSFFIPTAKKDLINQYA